MEKPVFFYLDNNRIAQKRLQNLLGDRAVVHALMDIEDALSMINNQMVADCFFVEYNLKDRDGLYFVKQLRTLSRYDAVPVVLFTGMVSDMLAYKAMRSGVNISISKLVPAAELFTTIEAQLKAPSTHLVKRPYWEIECATWQLGATCFQFCPGIGETVQGDSEQEVTLKMRSRLAELIGGGESTPQLDLIDIGTHLHRIVRIAT